MRKKVYRNIFIISFIVLALSIVLSSVIFRDVFNKQVKSDIYNVAQIIKKTYEKSGKVENLQDLGEVSYRITLVNQRGVVEFESKTNKPMENHLDRPEIKDALKNGEGTSVRISATLGVSTYYYAVKLTNGKVLRISLDTTAMGYYLQEMVYLLVGIAVLIGIIAFIIAKKLTDRIVKPIEDMGANLDDIDSRLPYEELIPFAESVKNQQEAKLEIENLRRDFTANVSHELKTPLTSISGYAEMIETGIAEAEDVKTFAGKIRQESGRLLTLIGDIIELSKLDSWFSKEDFEEIDLYKIAANSVEMLSHTAEKKNIKIYLEGKHCKVSGSSDQLEELCYNLIDNGIKYNKLGGEIRVSVAEEDNHTVLKIRDTGIGISEEDQKRIFERFYRVDKSRSKRMGGTGLGLAIVKHIAIRHDCVIKVESALGRGTEIAIIFPTDEEA